MERLFEVSRTGDVTSLREMLSLDPDLLHRAFTGFCDTPLHTAVMYGHVPYAEEILKNKLELSLELDSQGFTPLHLASARTNLQMVELLLQYNPDACIVLDQEGRTPLHLASMKGRVDIMKVLIQAKPGAIQVLLDRKETILHMCVKHNRLEALKLLMESLPAVPISPHDESVVSINSKDEDGNTILHLATARRQWKMIKYLLQSRGVHTDVINNNALTLLHMLAESERDDLEIGDDHLRGAVALDLRSNEQQQQEVADDRHDQTVVVDLRANEQQQEEAADDRHDETEVVDMNQSSQRNGKSHQNDNLATEDRNILFLVATIIATIAFQAIMSPPGGVFQDDSTISLQNETSLFIHYLLLVQPKPLEVQYINKSASSMDYLISNLTESVGGYYFEFDPPGMIKEDDLWKDIISNHTGSFPYLVRYAGTPIFAYLYPNQYSSYITSFSVAFFTCLTIILSPIVDFMNIVNKRRRLVALKMMLYASVICVSAGFSIGYANMCPPYNNGLELLKSSSVSLGISILCHVWPRLRLWLKKKLKTNESGTTAHE